MIDIPGPVLEFINGVKFVVFSGLTLFFLLYVVRKLTLNGWRHWTSIEVKFGWALATLCAGDALLGGTVWISRHRINEGMDQVLAWPAPFVVLTACATALSCWGAICALRVATPRKSGEWPWVAVVIIAFVASAFLAWDWRAII